MEFRVYGMEMLKWLVDTVTRILRKAGRSKWVLRMVQKIHSLLLRLTRRFPGNPRITRTTETEKRGQEQPSTEIELSIPKGQVCCSTLPHTRFEDQLTVRHMRDDTLVTEEAPSHSHSAAIATVEEGRGRNDFGGQYLSPRHSVSQDPEKGSDVVLDDIPNLTDIVENLYPVGVDESERYTRDNKIPKGVPDQFVLPRLSTDFSPPSLPLQWTRYVHPEGAVYFWDSDRRVVTDAYILEPEVYNKVEDVISRIDNYTKYYGIAIASLPTVHLYLEELFDGSFGYYFVDHRKKILFWLDQKYAYPIVQELKTNTVSLDHLQLELTSQYWYHNEYFPHLAVSDEALKTLQDMVWHAAGDLLTSSTSTVPYTLDDTSRMQTLVGEFAAHYHAHRHLETGATTVIYRLLGLFTHQRFLNFHGQKVARLSRTQSLFEENKRTWFINILSPLFFYAPEVYLKKLQAMCVDSLVNQPSWNTLLERLTEEWKEYILYATVLLTSNVSFLAIQSLDELGSTGYRDPAQRTSYFSVAVSIGVITLGLLLVRQHHTTLDRRFLLHRSVTSIGLETLAVMYSLPHALLMYGMISFFLAFSIFCTQSKDTITIVLLTFAWTVVVVLLLWCISSSFEYTTYERPWLIRKVRALGDRLRGRTKFGS